MGNSTLKIQWMMKRLKHLMELSSLSGHELAQPYLMEPLKELRALKQPLSLSFWQGADIAKQKLRNTLKKNLVMI